ncbi:Exportin-2 [Balamuthia mandrillaris]
MQGTPSFDTEENLRAITGVLAQTFSEQQASRKEAESHLKQVESSPGFLILLLKLLGTEGIDNSVKVAASIYFKNVVKNNWQRIEGHQPDVVITSEDRTQIKTVIVDLMLSVNVHIQRQLAESLSIISQYDFPWEWETLLPNLIQKLDSKDFNVINGVLRTIHSIFKRYRHQYKSDAILRELQYILGVFEKPFLQLFLALSKAVESNASQPSVLRVLFVSLDLVAKIYYSLCYVDLPDYFEDTLNESMGEFHKYLNFKSTAPELVSDDDEEPGVLHELQASICQNINLFIGKYEEEFAPFLPIFVEDVWRLLTELGSEIKFDTLATSAIGFLTSISTSVHYELFKDPNTLKSICEKIVIPNINFRDSDEELFEDNPLEYIRRDIEGSDSDTRRRSASELVKGMRKHYEAQVTQIFSAYITSMLEQYSNNPSENWKAKDAAIYLVTALTVVSATAAAGATRTNQLIDVVSFFASQILPELQGKQSDSLVLKADALKFATSFRGQLPPDALTTAFPLAVSLLESENYVVHTYAATFVERVMTVKATNASTGVVAPIFGKDKLQPVLARLLINLFNIFNRRESQENDYVMKTIMRVINTAKEDIMPMAEEILKQLTVVLGRVYKNPTNPGFNHYLFESIAALMRVVCTTDPSRVAVFENHLFPAFQAILMEDITEFAPYVFQLLSFLLELRTDSVTEAYIQLFPPLLTPALWTRTGNVPALVRLLQAYLRKAAPEIVAGGHLKGILGVFQKLIASSVTDHEGFYLLEAIVEHVDPTAFTEFLPTIFQLVFSRLMSCKTMKFIRSFLVFLCLFIGKHGASFVVQQIDSVDAQLFNKVLVSLWIPNVQKVSGVIERKMCAIAMTKLLTECPEMLSEPYFAHWGDLLRAVISIFEEPEDESVPADVADNYVEVEESAPGYSTAYSQLVYAHKDDIDPFKTIDAKAYFAHSLNKLSIAHPGKFQEVLNQYLPPAAMAILQNYFKESNVPEPYIH